jgi:hypothetical protein
MLRREDTIRLRHMLDGATEAGGFIEHERPAFTSFGDEAPAEEGVG